MSAARQRLVLRRSQAPRLVAPRRPLPRILAALERHAAHGCRGTTSSRTRHCSRPRWGSRRDGCCVNPKRGGTSVIEVQRVDYIRVPVTDMEEANRFYGEVLGLERNPNSPAD